MKLNVFHWFIKTKLSESIIKLHDNQKRIVNFDEFLFDL